MTLQKNQGENAKCPNLNNRNTISKGVSSTNAEGNGGYNIDGIFANDDSSGAIINENLEWYIQLASRCHNEGFQWHMNYLNNCSNRSALQHSRRLVSSSSSFNKSGHCFGASTTVPDKTYKKIYIKNYDENFNEDGDCKIRIKIGTPTLRNFNHYNNNGSTNKKRLTSFVPYPTNSNSTKNIMNCNSVDTQNKQFSIQSTDKINEIIDNFCSLRISCGTVLPQIILTDFSSHDTTPISTPLLLTPSSTTASHLNYSFNGAKSMNE